MRGESTGSLCGPSIQREQRPFFKFFFKGIPSQEKLETIMKRMSLRIDLALGESQSALIPNEENVTPVDS